MTSGVWFRAALCAGVLAGCGGTIHKENQDTAAHSHPGQDGGVPEQGDRGGATGNSNLEHGHGGRGAGGVSAGLGGGETSGTPGSNGGSGAPAGVGSNIEADAAVTVIDPRRDERMRLVEQYCAACNNGPDCVPQMINMAFSLVAEKCWDAWIASMNCSVANGCTQVTGGPVGTGACLAERNALDDCQVSTYVDGKVTGSTGTCSWERSQSGTTCLPFCPDDLVDFYDSDCDGPPGGPFLCFCRLNGVVMADALIENGTQYYVDSCEEAAGKLANGYCQQFTNCCYTYTGVVIDGTPERTLCECTSSPAAGHFSSCADLAASKKNGKVVDICARYGYE